MRGRAEECQGLPPIARDTGDRRRVLLNSGMDDGPGGLNHCNFGGMRHAAASAPPGGWTTPCAPRRCCLRVSRAGAAPRLPQVTGNRARKVGQTKPPRGTAQVHCPGVVDSLVRRLRVRRLDDASRGGRQRSGQTIRPRRAADLSCPTPGCCVYFLTPRHLPHRVY